MLKSKQIIYKRFRRKSFRVICVQKKVEKIFNKLLKQMSELRDNIDRKIIERCE